MSGASEPLDVGRAQRTVPLGIRHALIARDRGCRFPGCDRAGGDRDAEAIRHLDTADRIAPTRIRNDPIARDLVLTLDRRARRRTWELDSLRNRFGISAEGSLARGTACTPSGRNSP